MDGKKDSTKRFSDRVDNYRRYRPGYPSYAGFHSDLKDLFALHSKNGTVRFNYKTEVYSGRM